MQGVDPSLSKSTRPAGQAIHSDWPEMEYEPGEHVKHSVPGSWSVSAFPLVQVLQFVAPSGEYMPMVQYAQGVPGKWSVSARPGGQAVQVVSPTKLYVPAQQTDAFTTDYNKSVQLDRTACPQPSMFMRTIWAQGTRRRGIAVVIICTHPTDHTFWTACRIELSN